MYGPRVNGTFEPVCGLLNGKPTFVLVGSDGKVGESTSLHSNDVLPSTHTPPSYRFILETRFSHPAVRQVHAHVLSQEKSRELRKSIHRIDCHPFLCQRFPDVREV
jgi:hypothetical protein